MSFKDIIFVVAIIMNCYEKVFLIPIMPDGAISLHAQRFADYFADKTLRVDYIFTGNAARQEICLDGLSCLPSWAGRKHHCLSCPCKETDKSLCGMHQWQRNLQNILFFALPGVAGNG